MPCLSYLSQLREAYPEIRAMGAGAVAVATGAGYQARHLMETGTPFPCLVDPERRLYGALGLSHIAWSRFVRPSTWARYLRSRGGARQGRITGDPLQAPGVVVLGPDRRVAYLHRGQTLGDYPPLPEVLAAVRGLVAEAPGDGPGAPGAPGAPP
ncbi:MAG: AhpC/TSA family protein, partial [Acidimicrobiales bacterium]